MTMIARIIAFIGTTVLLWTPVLVNAKEKDPCPIPSTGQRISILEDPPFTEFGSGKPEGILGEYFAKIIKQCFLDKRECSNLTEKSFQLEKFNSTDTTSFLKHIKENKTDMAFPLTVLMKMYLSSENYTGPSIMFVEFMKSVEYALIMDVDNFNKKANDIVFDTLITNTWPIIVFTLLIAGISGIFVWILETYFNEEEFPRSFTKGSYEGFWWAFVSMTTVGYGDKTPKYIFGRFFGVFWILLGLVVIAMFTATATSALNVSSSDLARLEGNKIGVMNFSSAQLEGAVKGANMKEYSSFKSMFEALELNKIDGILMDKYKAGYHLNKTGGDRFKVFNSFKENIPYYLAIRQTDMTKRLLTDGSCFNEELEKQDMGELLMSNLKPVTVYNSDSDAMSAFSGNNPSTHRFLLIILAVFVGLVVLGIVAEIIYRKVWRKKKVNSDQDGIELKEVRVNPVSRVSLKDVEDKLSQLVREVGKLQEQLSTMTSHTNGMTGLGQNVNRM